MLRSSLLTPSLIGGLIASPFSLSCVQANPLEPIPSTPALIKASEPHADYLNKLK